MSETLDDLGPWPTNSEDATAEAVGKAIAVRAYARMARIHAPDRDLFKEDPDQYRAEINVLVNEYGVVWLLKVLTEFHRDVADDAARELWAEWEAGDSLGEWLWEWLDGWGIDAEQIIQIERNRSTEAAQKAATP